MFQSFDSPTSPEAGPPRLAALRGELAHEGLQGFLIPRADAHQGEYVAPRDDRLAWLTGFTGSAGFCIALEKVAGVFVDGRYRVQVKAQVDLGHFTPVDWPETKPGDWLKTQLPGGVVGFDPWLHAVSEIETLQRSLDGSGIGLRASANLLDRCWADQPAPPLGAITPYPLDFAGETAADKCARLARTLTEAGHRAAVITLPDSIAWLLNIRGTDIPRNPVPHCFAILHESGAVDLFAAPEKLDSALREHLGAGVRLCAPGDFGPRLQALTGPVRIDPASCPVWVQMQLGAADIRIARAADPCILPKACKNTAEIEGSRSAHLRDAVAMCRLLAWFDSADKAALHEVDIVTALEGFRAETNALRDISFDTICGSGPNGALPHYRVSQASNRQLRDGDLIVLDSGGQYLDGTTDITRTLMVGQPGPEEKACFTRVLQGMIGISRLRFPRGLAGQHLDAIARRPLWEAGLDYDHGTGHGVGTYLCVHEGPQRLSRLSDVALQPGMILSNEPGYYREGAFGIRIENLIVVQAAPDLPGGDKRAMLDFETLTWVPIDTRLIDQALLTRAEVDWINAYHAACREKIAPRLDDSVAIWLHRATEPI
ncbi:aminopeptidase P family protein [Pseudooceanicola sp.]|uniref:aminopeptidase P family protein n=1 Tax=Pseudooceanicola sp. TaxID=1914328 RepID=UPI0026262D83|nr:aminopeptidase P family protein [Pseudooceanicola sp.]MDF1854367.1 aminopeptidase P family protein [Pseudooceanicola sp.]